MYTIHELHAIGLIQNKTHTFPKEDMVISGKGIPQGLITFFGHKGKDDTGIPKNFDCLW